MIDAAALKARFRPATDKVDVPEWGGEIILRSLTVGERGAFLEQGKKSNDFALAAWLVETAAITENSEPLFRQGDLAGLPGDQLAVIDRLAHRVLVLSGLGGEAKTGPGN